jgi:hypothetical protein
MRSMALARWPRYMKSVCDSVRVSKTTTLSARNCQPSSASRALDAPSAWLISATSPALPNPLTRLVINASNKNHRD